jgi:hypothetical protein
VAERKTIILAGTTVDVTELEVMHRRREEPNEYELEDGSVIRVSSPTMVVYRVEGPLDAEGNPTFFVKNGISTVVVRGPRTTNGQSHGGSSKDKRSTSSLE